MSTGGESQVITFEDGWAVIKEKISKFLSNVEGGMTMDHYKIPAREYIAIYNKIFSMAIQRDPFNHSAPLYEKYCLEISSYLKDCVIKALRERRQQNEINFLREWPVRFENHRLVEKGLADMFTYLDRFYIPGNAETCAPLRLKAWYLYQSLVYDEFKVNIRDAILGLIRRERDGEPQDRLLLKNAVQVFIELGFKTTRDHGTNASLQLYKNDLQVLLVDQTREFYAGKAKLWLSQDSCPDYMLKAETAILDEESRLKEYLHGSSRDALMGAVHAELVSAVIEPLLAKDTGADYLFEKRAYDDLKRLHFLLSRVPGGLEAVAPRLRDFVRRLGTSIVEAQKQTDGKDADDAHSFMRQLMTLHDQYRAVERDCFNNAQCFQKALKEAFEDFVNLEGTVSKLLAKFANDALKKGTKIEQSELDSTLNNVVMLYGYVREKDVFEHDYQVHLSTRLLAGTSESEHSEKSMISKLKTECGYQWTSKLEGMFKDVQLSKDLSTNFRMLHERKLNFEFDVTVCTSGSWPAQAVPPCRVPTEATAVCQLFKEFYLHSLNGRRLEWRFDMGQADVKVRFGSENVKELIVTPYQMAILLLFNHAESMTYKEIAEASGIAREHLDQHILSLAHPKIKVLLKEPNNPRVDDADKFQLNPAFASKLYKTRVPLIKTTSHVKQEETDRDAEVEMQRKHQVDAALVRIMKTRKTLSHNQLVTEVVQQLSARFTPKVTVIRTRIEHLIEQEYLERDSKDRSVYNYLA